jgi:hypothetical protein
MLIRFAPLPWEAELSQASQAEAGDGYSRGGRGNHERAALRAF